MMPTRWLVNGSVFNSSSEWQCNMTKFQLMALVFGERQTRQWRNPNGRVIVGYLQSIEREDCSGSSFNVNVWNQETHRTEMVYVHTID